MPGLPRVLAVSLLVAALGAVPSGDAAAASAGRATPVRLGAAPVAVAVGQHDVWAVVETKHEGAMLWRLDSQTGHRVGSYRIGVPGPDLGAVAVADGHVWAAAGGRVVAIDLLHREPVAHARLPGVATSLTIGFGSVWVAVVGARRDLIVRLDARTLARRAVVGVDEPTAILAAAGSVWVAEPSSLDRVDPRTNRLVATVASLSRPTALASTGDGVWVADQTSAVAVDRSGHPQRRLGLPFAPGALAATRGRLWVTNNCGCPDGRVVLLDPATGRTLGAWTVGEIPLAIAVAGTTAWVASFGDDRLWRIPG